MRILVVEDEKKVASFIKRGLEEDYYSVDIALDGKEGSRLSLEEEYDLIILDIHTINGNGSFLNIIQSGDQVNDG